MSMSDAIAGMLTSQFLYAQKVREKNSIKFLMPSSKLEELLLLKLVTFKKKEVVYRKLSS